jgi:hypothetical protein
MNGAPGLVGGKVRAVGVVRGSSGSFTALRMTARAGNGKGEIRGFFAALRMTRESKSLRCAQNDRLKLLARRGLRGVVGVDVDVFGGEVAGEEAGAGGAFAEVDGDGVFGGEHDGVGGGFVEGGGAEAVLEDGLSNRLSAVLAANPDAGAVGGEGGSAAACGGHETAPVGIAGGPGGFAERAVGDGAGDELCIGGGGGVADVESDDVGDAFAVGDDLPGERLADFGERGVEGGSEFPAEMDAGGSAGDEQDGVVGGGVAVDGDGVEGGLDGCGECGVERGHVGGDVGEEIDEHGGVGRA